MLGIHAGFMCSNLEVIRVEIEEAIITAPFNAKMLIVFSIHLTHPSKSFDTFG